jgi:hypothetical protein
MKLSAEEKKVIVKYRLERARDTLITYVTQPVFSPLDERFVHLSLIPL